MEGVAAILESAGKTCGGSAEKVGALAQVVLWERVWSELGGYLTVVSAETAGW